MFTIERTISEEVVENVIVTALEGGSNYWYYLSDVTVRMIKHNTPEMEGEPLSMRFTKALSKGVEVTINDYENPADELGVISLKTMGERTLKLIEDGYGSRFENMVDEIGDADDADVIFQYWVMNELVFG